MQLFTPSSSSAKSIHSINNGKGIRAIQLNKLRSGQLWTEGSEYDNWAWVCTKIQQAVGIEEEDLFPMEEAIEDRSLELPPQAEYTDRWYCSRLLFTVLFTITVHGQLENVPLDICGIKLDGTNYLIWSRTFTLTIEARGMSEFIEEPVIQPEEVLGRVPFPSLGETYAIVQQEESRRGSMLHTPPSDRSALIAIPQGGKLQTSTSNGTNDRESLRCDYCQNTGHTRDFCWKLHGRPPHGRGSGRSGRGRGTVRPQAQAHVSESAVVASSLGSGFISSEQVGRFSQGEMQALRRLMAQAESSPTIAPTSTSSYFAHTG
ncbi:hypothetical protein Acr_06g0007620 [Actinidia rufa]|uniref:Uncharacterized protein n=1 Tax=Actinidia rufa TaxID=165716 RepID=A0A7J0ER61_9ERIC|nr:hypothetical protein Acr_06g0007620 [Actinidia rufa]